MVRTLLSVTVVALVAGGAPALAQPPGSAPGSQGVTSRAALIARAQAEKAERLEPDGPTRVEDFVARYVSGSTFFGGQLRGFYPWMGSVFGGSGAALGFGYHRRLAYAAYVDASTGLSINGSYFGQVAAHVPAGDRVSVDLLARFTDVNDVTFHGLGQESSRDGRISYDYRPIVIGATARAAPLRWLRMDAGVSRLTFNTSSDAAIIQVEPSPAPALGHDVSYNVFSASAAIDTRPAPAYSTSGTHLAVRWARHAETANRPFSFDRMEYEASQLVPLVRAQYVLAFRALLSTTATGGGNDVPLVLQPYLGSGDTLRGFGNRRFTGRQAALLTAEYRWRPSRYLDLALFVDAGQVASSVERLSAGRFDRNWGVGARFHGPTFSAFRVELARSREGLRLVWAAAQPF